MLLKDTEYTNNPFWQSNYQQSNFSDIAIIICRFPFKTEDTPDILLFYFKIILLFPFGNTNMCLLKNLQSYPPPRKKNQSLVSQKLKEFEVSKITIMLKSKIWKWGPVPKFICLKKFDGKPTRHSWRELFWLGSSVFSGMPFYYYFLSVSLVWLLLFECKFSAEHFSDIAKSIFFKLIHFQSEVIALSLIFEKQSCPHKMK